MPEYASINPNDQSTQADNSQEFSALVHVISSRYVERTYESPDIKSKVAIQWTMGTTKGNTFERKWTTGIEWEPGIVSADGKKIKRQIKAKSDAGYLIKKAIAADFPAEKLTDDISVFDNEVFFMHTDKNPQTNGSYRGLYPKQYHPEGWDAALAETLARRAAREAQQNAPAYSSQTTQTGSYTPPPVIQSKDVLSTANETLIAILQNNNYSVNRNQIPTKVQEYKAATGKTWDDATQKSIVQTLWVKDQLSQIINNNPKLKLDGDTISLQN